MKRIKKLEKKVFSEDRQIKDFKHLGVLCDSPSNNIDTYQYLSGRKGTATAKTFK